MQKTTSNDSFLDIMIDPGKYEGNSIYRVNSNINRESSLEEHAESILDQVPEVAKEVEIDFSLAHRWVFLVYYYTADSTVRFSGKLLKRIVETFPNIKIEISSVQLVENSNYDEDN